MLVEIHALQSFGPSNLNRDDTGNPKDTIFGGVRRLRISSQAQKRPIRLSSHFREEVEADKGIRTKKLLEVLTTALVARAIDEERAKNLASAFVQEIAGLDKEKGLSSVLVYISPQEQTFIVDKLAEAAAANDKDLKKVVTDVVKQLAKDKDRLIAPDLALFGRMLANTPELNVDAAAQVAHAISTHSSLTEFDYFTAVDDLAPKEETGAGMIGTVAFGSATYYRYGRVDVDLLRTNLGADAALAQATVRGFLRAFIYALPTGKQNTFAAHNLPDFVIGIVRPDNQGWSLANAFETPIRPTRSGGYLEPSVQALISHWAKMERAYGLVDPKATVILNIGEHNWKTSIDEDHGVLETTSARDFLNAMASAFNAEA